MDLISYPDVNALVDLVLAELRAVLDRKLAGLYVVGSLVTGGFRPDVSDVDLVALTAGEVDGQETAALRSLHEGFVNSGDPWLSRLDVAYLSLEALRACPPDYCYPAVWHRDPLHLEPAFPELTILRHALREKGIAVCGPAPITLCGPVSREELVDSIRQACRGTWREFVADSPSRKEQVFWVLTMCRALYTVSEGDIVSKRAGALWAAQRTPEWSALIHLALNMWENGDSWWNGQLATDSTWEEARRFVTLAIEEIAQPRI